MASNQVGGVGVSRLVLYLGCQRRLLRKKEIKSLLIEKNPISSDQHTQAHNPAHVIQSRALEYWWHMVKVAIIGSQVQTKTEQWGRSLDANADCAVFIFVPA